MWKKKERRIRDEAVTESVYHQSGKSWQCTSMLPLQRQLTGFFFLRTNLFHSEILKEEMLCIRNVTGRSLRKTWNSGFCRGRKEGRKRYQVPKLSGWMTTARVVLWFLVLFSHFGNDSHMYYQFVLYYCQEEIKINVVRQRRNVRVWIYLNSTSCDKSYSYNKGDCVNLPSNVVSLFEQLVMLGQIAPTGLIFSTSLAKDVSNHPKKRVWQNERYACAKQ